MYIYKSFIIKFRNGIQALIYHLFGVLGGIEMGLPLLLGMNGFDAR